MIEIWEKDPVTGKKVLIIDDDAYFVDYLSMILKHLNIELISAKNGVEGIKFSIERKPDLIFLDIRMSNVSGLQVLEVLKALDQTKKIPVLIVSGYPDQEVVTKSISLGAIDFIVKPCSKKVIEDRLRRIFVNHFAQEKPI